MPKYKICIINTIKLFDHVEVFANDEMEAKRKAVRSIKENEEAGLQKWNEEEKPAYKMELIN